MITVYAAPVSMPCYVDPRGNSQSNREGESKPEPESAPNAEAAKRRKTKTGRRRSFKIASVPDWRWRELFERRPLMENSAIAKILNCSKGSVKTMRHKMGYPSVPSGGFYRQEYFRKDAEELARKRIPGERLFQLADRLGLSRRAVHHFADKFRDLFPIYWSKRKAAK